MHNEVITTDTMGLLRQAPPTVAEWLFAAYDLLKSRGFDPHEDKDLLIAAMQLMQSDFNNGLSAKIQEAGLQKISSSLEEIACALADK